MKNGIFSPPHVHDCNSCLEEVWTWSDPGIQDWRVTANNVDVYSASLAHFPYQAVDLSGRSRSGIAQVSSTTPGTTVRITWQNTRNTHDSCKSVANQGYNVTVEGTEVEPGLHGTWHGRHLVGAQRLLQGVEVALPAGLQLQCRGRLWSP
ncbi:hypothetical protein [Streptomyces capoamus]|uniref:hypothetical protein n=1 Tax=Streptomyces capoamus TaxID=68183 RepID=UPI0033977694